MEHPIPAHQVIPDHYVALLAGGSGTRFWPLSRRLRPKQLLPLVGGRTLLRATYDRVCALVPPERVIVVTGRHLEAAIRADLPMLPPENVLAEPTARNTAPAVGLAVAWAARRSPRAVVTVLPADHHIADEDAFRAAISRAAAFAAEHGDIALLGVQPTRPETGFGYFEVAQRPGEAALRVSRFVEKPSLDRAREYLAAGNFLWNSGSFFLRVDTTLAAFDRHLPELGAALRRYAAGTAAIDDVYAASPSVSIDYGVMEKEHNLAAFPLDAGWSDVGSWESLAEVHEPDAAGNAGNATLLAIDSSGCLVHAPGKVVALLGVRDLVVVDTPDAILVCPRERTQDVRQLVDALAAKGRTDLV